MHAGKLDRGLKHTQNCLEISRANSAPAIELVFGNEALAQIEKANGNNTGFSDAIAQMKSELEKLTLNDQAWSEKILSKLLQLS